jgi:hypothetical protein
MTYNRQDKEPVCLMIHQSTLYNVFKDIIDAGKEFILNEREPCPFLGKDTALVE